MSEENNETPVLQSKEISTQASMNQFYCWLCGEETFGADICTACGMPQ